MHELKQRPFELLMLLVSFHERRRQPPSLRELAKLLGIGSVSTVHHHVTVLEREGYLERLPTQNRAIRLTDKAFEHCRQSLRTRRTGQR